MSESDLIEKIAAAVADRIGSSDDLWGMGRVAKYLDRNVQTVRNRIACLPSFPRAIRLPVSGTAQPLYNAAEVMQWAQKYKEKN